jgi:catechol 2,3-dioxygenase-like lactoylglutathione lyase family enzyme
VRFTRSSSHHDQTISFYRDVLGLPVVEEFADSFGEDGTIFGLPDTHVQLEIVRGSRVTSQNPPAHPAGSQGLSAHRLPVMDLWQRLEPCAYVPCRPSDTTTWAAAHRSHGLDNPRLGTGLHDELRSSRPPGPYFTGSRRPVAVAERQCV